MKHHDLDVYSIPKGKTPLYVNEIQVADQSVLDGFPEDWLPDQQVDNIRIYIPLDLNKHAIIRRLEWIVNRYKEANEENESDFQQDVEMLVSQIEIYDQIWYVRHIPGEGKHSQEAVDLVREFVDILKDIPDGCAELFPFELIDELMNEYLI